MAEKLGLKRVQEHHADTEACSKRRQITDSTTDRISQLPESIIHNILSFLSTKDVVRARVLSKTWQCMCSSFPMYDFSDSLFGLHSVPWCYGSFQSKALEIRNKRENFMNFVNSCLLNQCEQYATIRRFRLSMSVHDNSSTSEDISIQKIEDLIELAVQNHVQELDLYISRRKYESYISFPRKLFNWLPQSVLSSKSLEILRLRQLADLTMPFSGNYNIYLPSLRVLSLKDCTFDNQFIGNLSSSCPMLEDFALIYCFELRNLQLSGFQKLKKFEMYGCRIQKIEIAVPSLQILRLDGQGDSDQFEVDVGAFNNLQFLKLKFPDLPNHLCQEIGTKFPLLKVLCLVVNLNSINISSPSLEKLVLLGTMNSIEISCPCLKKLSVHSKGVHDLVIETPLLYFFKYFIHEIPSFFSIYSPKLQRLAVCLGMKMYLNPTHHFLKMREFLKKFSCVDCLNLMIEAMEVQFYQTGHWNDLFIPDEGCLQLCIVVPIIDRRTCFDNLIDGLFWSFRPKSITMVSVDESHYEFIKVLYEKLMHESNIETCCKSCATRCWRHSLKDFQIEGLGAAAGDGAQAKGLKSTLLYDSNCSTLPRSTDITFLLNW